MSQAPLQQSNTDAAGSTTTAKSTTDPFAPAGITFQPVSPTLTNARFIVAAMCVLPPLIAAIVLAVLVSGWFWIAGAVMVGIGLWLGWLIPRQVRALGYAEAADDLIVRRGIMFKKLTIIPYGRMQIVDVSEGPIARRYQIATVQLHTAAAETDAEIAGLPLEEANRLRDRLSARGEARLAGL